MTETNGAAESLTLSQHLSIEAIVAATRRCPEHPGAVLVVEQTLAGITVSCLVCSGPNLAGQAPAPAPEPVEVVEGVLVS